MQVDACFSFSLAWCTGWLRVLFYRFLFLCLSIFSLYFSLLHIFSSYSPFVSVPHQSSELGGSEFRRGLPSPHVGLHGVAV